MSISILFLNKSDVITNPSKLLEMNVTIRSL